VTSKEETTPAQFQDESAQSPLNGEEGGKRAGGRRKDMGLIKN